MTRAWALIPSWFRLPPSRSALQLLQPMGGVGEVVAVVSAGALGTGAATAADIPAANPRESSTESKHLTNLACIERLLGVVDGNVPCPHWSNAHVLRAIDRRVNTYIR